MKYFFLLIISILSLSQAMAQSSFWVVKGGTGDEGTPYRSSHLDTTAGGDIIWMYNTRSNPTSDYDLVMEIWPQGAMNPSREYLISTAQAELLHNLYTYQSEIYIAGAALNPAVVNNGRAFTARMDTTGNVISTFLQHGPNMGNYGNQYAMQFLEDTAFVVGQGRSNIGGNREDYLFTKIDLQTHTALVSKRFHALGTERMRDICISPNGESLHVAAYSYSTPGSTYPVFVSLDRKGNVLQSFRYGGHNRSFSKILPEGDSLTLLGGNPPFVLRMDQDGNIGWSKAFVASGGGSLAFSDIQKHNNQYYLIGNISSSIQGQGGKEGLLVVTDLFGNVQWSKIYTGNGDESILDIQFMPDGMYLTGTTTTSLLGGTDVFLVKADHNGAVAVTSPCYSVVDFTSQIIASVGPSFSKTTQTLTTASGSLTTHSHATMSVSTNTNMVDDNCSVLAVGTNQTDLAGQTLELTLQAYPNPFSDHLMIDLPAKGRIHLSLRLMDMQGRLVASQKLITEDQDRYRWELPDLKSGMYVVQVNLHDAAGSVSTYCNTLVRD